MKTLNSRTAPSNHVSGSRLVLLGCLVACLAAVVGMSGNSTPVVSAHTLLETDGAHPGSSVKAAVIAEVSPGFHINDHNPNLDYLIPTELKLEAPKELNVDKVVYPKGELIKFVFADQALSVYEGKFVVGVVVKIDRTVRPGTYTINGNLTYQACNDHACFPPARVALSLTVKVVPRGVSLKRLNADVFNKVQLE
jgi:DsbC/DsbD-like thiol-disulfide interchange protein